MHSLAQPYAKAGGGPFGGGQGNSASRDNAPRNCSDNATGHNNNTSRDNDPPSSAFPWGLPANNGSRCGLGTASAMSNITPHAVDVVNLEDNRNVHLDLMLKAASLCVIQDVLQVNWIAVGFSNAEGDGMYVCVVNNDAIPGVVNAGTAITDSQCTGASCGKLGPKKLSWIRGPEHT